MENKNMTMGSLEGYAVKLNNRSYTSKILRIKQIERDKVKL
jgi:hypothetical protein